MIFHLQPLLKFFENIPEQLDEKIIKEIIEKTFKKLKPNIKIRVDFLCTNIQNNISAAVENIEIRKKQKTFQQAAFDRKKERKVSFDKEQEIQMQKKLLKNYQTFYINNQSLFNEIEISKLNQLFPEQKILQIGTIIEPKLN